VTLLVTLGSVASLRTQPSSSLRPSNPSLALAGLVPGLELGSRTLPITSSSPGP
jgi:hypothetical protein